MNKSRIQAQRIATCGMLLALMLVLGFVESQLPVAAGIPGIKLGLSNIITVFAVFSLGPGEAAAILFARIFLGAIFGGNFSTILYSGAGGACAIIVTIVLRRILTKKQLWVAGALGAIGHSVGQMAMAVLLTATPGLLVYLPVMILCSVISGTFTGLCAQILVNRGKDLWKITSK